MSTVRTTRSMRPILLRTGPVSCPPAESLVAHALSADDPSVARHVEDCSTCRAEVARLRETATVLRGQALLEARAETPQCLDDLAIADFVEGRLSPEARAPVVTHLLTCAHCRAAVRATGRLLSDAAVATEVSGVARAPGGRRWRHWSMPLGAGAAAAAALLLFLWPRIGDDSGSTPRLREPAITRTVAPVPIAPVASAAQVDRLVWSSVAGAERYRLRLYDDEGSVLWMAETGDTSVALPDSVVLSPGIPYFWRVEAQTEWRRWAASDLMEFRVVGPGR